MPLWYKEFRTEAISAGKGQLPSIVGGGWVRVEQNLQVFVGLMSRSFGVNVSFIRENPSPRIVVPEFPVFAVRYLL